MPLKSPAVRKNPTVMAMNILPFNVLASIITKHSGWGESVSINKFKRDTLRYIE
jgi:hypothetical protein